MSVQAAYSNLPWIFMRSLVADMIRLISIILYSILSVFFTYVYHDARFRECNVNSHWGITLHRVVYHCSNEGKISQNRKIIL